MTKQSCLQVTKEVTTVRNIQVDTPGYFLLRHEVEKAKG